MTQQLSADPRWIRGVRAALLRHFDAHARALPWRGTPDPYAVWVSEIMLQQTRVAAVLPYYQRWLERFPTVDALADAPLDDVLKLWEGLGYYSRARNLHRAAAVVREHHHGMLPADFNELRALPGIGGYTAGAIASIAYGVRRPAVDGNVRRVLARLLDDPAPGAQALRAVTGALVPEDRPGDFNQAVMELGATICTPRSPRCAACPVTPYCGARAAGTVLERPAPRRRTAPPRYTLATAVITDRKGRVLLTRRPATGLLARMWCFPAREVDADADAADAACSLARSLLPGGRIERVAQLPTVTHTFTHRREQYLCWRIDATTSGEEVPPDAAWVDPDGGGHALPRAQRRILEHCLQSFFV